MSEFTGTCSENRFEHSKNAKNQFCTIIWKMFKCPVVLQKSKQTLIKNDLVEKLKSWY